MTGSNYNLHQGFITARKRSLGQGNIFSSVCQEFFLDGGVVSQHALQVVSQHALQVSRPTPRGEVEGSGWGVSRPTLKEEVEGSGLGGFPGPHLGGDPPAPHLGGGLQAHTWGVFRPTPLLGVSRPTPRGVSRPTPRGISQHALRQTPMATAAGDTHPTGMHSCFDKIS